jgi:hypothetical protein
VRIYLEVLKVEGEGERGGGVGGCRHASRDWREDVD